MNAYKHTYIYVYANSSLDKNQNECTKEYESANPGLLNAGRLGIVLYVLVNIYMTPEHKERNLE